MMSDKPKKGTLAQLADEIGLEEAVDLALEHGITSDRAYAYFMIALERGEVQGDVTEVEDEP